MKKQYFIYILLLAYGCSALAVKPKLQRTHAQQNAKNHTSQPVEALIEGENSNENDVAVEQPKKPTVLDSWRKLINPYRWGSLSRDDAWNIGGSVMFTGFVYYLYSRVNSTSQNGPHNGNQPPHGPFGGGPNGPIRDGNPPDNPPHDPLDLTLEQLQEQQDAFNAFERNRRQQEQDDLQFAQGLERQLEREEHEQQLREREALQRQRQERQGEFEQWQEERERLRQQQEEDELAEAIRQSQLIEDERNNNAPVVVNNAVADGQAPEVAVDRAQQRDCDICAETKNANEYTEMPCCQFSLCTACLMEHLTACLENNNTAAVTCPNRACTSAKIEQHIMQAITVNNRAVYDRYLDIEFNEYLMQQPQAQQCPTADCQFRFIPYDANVPDSVVCRQCQQRYCSHCLHDHDVERVTCEQARIERERQVNPDLAAQADLEYMANNTKQCTRCGNAVERNEGCNHMTCRCGYEFCFVCAKQWGDKQTCGYFNHR